MKTKLVLLAAFSLLFYGCDSNTPVTSNCYPNTITERQRLVAEFHSADVFIIPYADDQYVVRDTNGAIWYVKSDRLNKQQGGKTLVFGTNAPSVVTVTSDMDKAIAMAQVLTQAMIQAASNHAQVPVLMEDPVRTNGP